MPIEIIQTCHARWRMTRFWDFSTVCQWTMQTLPVLVLYIVVIPWPRRSARLRRPMQCNDRRIASETREALSSGENTNSRTFPWSHLEAQKKPLPVPQLSMRAALALHSLFFWSKERTNEISNVPVPMCVGDKTKMFLSRLLHIFVNSDSKFRCKLSWNWLATWQATQRPLHYQSCKASIVRLQRTNIPNATLSLRPDNWKRSRPSRFGMNGCSIPTSSGMTIITSKR
jgi:hypothetical protein